MIDNTILDELGDYHSLIEVTQKDLQSAIYSALRDFGETTGFGADDINIENEFVGDRTFTRLILTNAIETRVVLFAVYYED